MIVHSMGGLSKNSCGFKTRLLVQMCMPGGSSLTQNLKPSMSLLQAIQVSVVACLLFVGRQTGRALLIPFPLLIL